MLIMYHI